MHFIKINDEFLVIFLRFIVIMLYNELLLVSSFSLFFELDKIFNFIFIFGAKA